MSLVLTALDTDATAVVVDLDKSKRARFRLDWASYGLRLSRLSLAIDLEQEIVIGFETTGLT